MSSEAAANQAATHLEPDSAERFVHALRREELGDAVGGVRAMLRLLRVGLHLAWGMSTVALVYPLLHRPARLGLKRRWSRKLLAIAGLRCEFSGAPLAAGAKLLVANHVSWLDVFVINALVPAAFVCKSEVRGWPAIGWLCARTETLFLPRGSRRAARDTVAMVASRLAEGWSVAVFPEGTTSDGQAVLPFHAALLQGALDAASVVQPIALRYCDHHGALSRVPAYCGNTSLLDSLWCILSARGLTVRVAVLPAIRGAGDRRAVSDRARLGILAALSVASSAGPGERAASAAPAPGL